MHALAAKPSSQCCPVCVPHGMHLPSGCLQREGGEVLSCTRRAPSLPRCAETLLLFAGVGNLSSVAPRLGRAEEDEAVGALAAEVLQPRGSAQVAQLLLLPVPDRAAAGLQLRSEIRKQQRSALGAGHPPALHCCAAATSSRAHTAPPPSPQKPKSNALVDTRCKEFVESLKTSTKIDSMPAHLPTHRPERPDHRVS